MRRVDVPGYSSKPRCDFFLFRRATIACAQVGENNSQMHAANMEKKWSGMMHHGS
jgi:hypothetical protein